MKKIILAFYVIGLSGFFGFVAPQADAVSGGEFQAGRIIDDTIFFNGSGMGAGEIQSFLNAKVPQCDTNGTQPYNGTTAANYSTARGYPPPYTCMKDYRQDTFSIPADAYCNGFTSGNKSAAQIIYEVGQSCGINQKVILITLQKEQSLVTDNFPWSLQYDKATGYACPDTAPCDPEFTGFFKQVYYGARQFKRYAQDSNTFTSYRAGRTSYVRYNPNASCGGTNLYVNNQATSGLYIYTPYQPNAAALNNLYGTGDGCSAYGNRNFWRMFNDWFGTTFSDRPVTNVPWKFENLEGSSGGLKPTSNTVGVTPETIKYNNELYTFYYDSTVQDLKLAVAGNSGWSFQTLDGNSTVNGRVNADVGTAVTSVVYNNMLHIFYYDTSRASMRHAWFTSASGWNFEELDGTVSSVSGIAGNVGMSNVAIEFDSAMHVLYYDGTRGNLREARYSTTLGWKFQNIDGDYGSLAGYNSNVGQNPEAMLYGGSLQLFYYDSLNGNLRHAWVNPGQAWRFENLDGDYGSVGRFNANVGQDPTVVEHAGSLQLFYYDANNGNLRHAWINPGQSWKFENLDGDYGSIAHFNGNVGSMAEALSFKNSLYVFYRDNSSGAIRYTWADSGGWHFAPLEGTPNSASGLKSNTGFWPTATGYGDAIQLYYFDNDQRALRHAFGIPFW